MSRTPNYSNNFPYTNVTMFGVNSRHHPVSAPTPSNLPISSKNAPKLGLGSITLPSTYTPFIKYAEDYFINPTYASSFTAAEHLIPHFISHLTPYLASPQHASSIAFLTTLQHNIIKELQFRARLATQPRNPWGRQRGMGLWLGEQIKLVALYLAYRVEDGQTSQRYDHQLLLHLAGLSEMGNFLDTMDREYLNSREGGNGA